MKQLNRKAAKRIAIVSITLSIVTGFIAWYASKENFEDSIVSLAYEEAEKISFASVSDRENLSAKSIADRLTGGLFDIAELYDTFGNKIAESLTHTGEEIEHKIPKHQFLNEKEAIYQSFNMKDGRWILRVFVPLFEKTPKELNVQLGYFEGVRVVPDWEKEQIFYNSLFVSALVSFASLACGFIIYPIVVHLTKENNKKTREVLDSHISMMEALGRAIAKRDSDTGAHNYRVAWIAALIGEKMGLSGAKMQSLIAGSFLHDVGKIGITDNILLKPGKLTDEEFEIMRTHVQQGEEIVHGMGWLTGAHEVVSAHHEKYNGTGYPRKLKAEDIPLSARIFAVADVFDALSSKRPYKEPMPYHKVMEILHKDTGSHFDPNIMDHFSSMSREIFEKLKNIDEQEARTLLEERVREHFYI
jgi:HD-GYP domain-containing protein (c-di-GMP phosphodiesterase class II)